MNESIHFSLVLHNTADTQLRYELKDHRLLPEGLRSPYNSQGTLNMPGLIVEWLHLKEEGRAKHCMKSMLGKQG